MLLKRLQINKPHRATVRPDCVAACIDYIWCVIHTECSTMTKNKKHKNMRWENYILLRITKGWQKSTHHLANTRASEWIGRKVRFFMKLLLRLSMSSTHVDLLSWCCKSVTLSLKEQWNSFRKIVGSQHFAQLSFVYDTNHLGRVRQYWKTVTCVETDRQTDGKNNWVVKEALKTCWLIVCFGIGSHRGQKQPRNAVFAQA